jgi:hypothetical protein
MKKCMIFVVAIVLLIGILPQMAMAQEIPFGVTAKEITVSGTLPTGDAINLVGYLHDSGKIIDDYVYASGNRIGVKIESIDYSIHFWNVGKMGGTSGFLFWKKDYSKAVMYLDYNVSENGYIIGDSQDGSKLGLPDSWPMQPATGEPKIKQASCVLEFSGGPTGTFEGICNNGSKISGRISAGNSIVFNRVEEPKDPKQVELAFRVISEKDLRLNGEFSDWKMDESGLVDSGTRFNSISGQVEIRHEAEVNGWKSAQLDTVLYVDDHIKTFEESEAILSFADMNTFVLKQETEIVLNAPPSKANKIKLVAGKVMANINKMMKDGSMEIDMSQAVAGIKGTRFILTETGAESKIEVAEGTVAFRSKINALETMVSAGEGVVSNASGLSKKTTFEATAVDNEILANTSITQSPNKNNNLAVFIILGVILLGAVTGVLWKIKRRRTN